MSARYAGKPQHVYFITDQRKRYVKIGVSNNPWWRVVDLQAGSPLRLDLALVLTFDTRQAAFSYEDAAHQHFAEYWRHGEWFDYGPAVKEFVRAWRDGGRPALPAPKWTCKQFTDEYGACLSKADAMASLREDAREAFL